MLKLLGGALLLLSGIGIGGVYLLTRKRSNEISEGWLDLVSYVCSEIRCYLTPLDEILKGYTGKWMDGKSRDLTELLEETKSDLLPETVEDLEIWSRNIQVGYAEEQIGRCRKVIEKLQKTVDAQKKEYREKTKTVTALSSCSVLAVLILLW